jgi:hypothetical protein
MFEPINIELQWPARRDDLEVCARQLQKTLECLGDFSKCFAKWARMPRSFTVNDATPIDNSNIGELSTILLKGQNREDVPPRRAIPSLGYTAHFWNMYSMEQYASLYVHCGMYSQQAGYNSIHFSVRQCRPPLLSPEQYINLLKGLLNIWDANLGVIYFKPSEIENADEKIYLAHFSIKGTDVNSYWPKTGRVVENYRGGELRVDANTRSFFAAGQFPSKKPDNFVRRLTEKILRFQR